MKARMLCVEIWDSDRSRATRKPKNVLNILLYTAKMEGQKPGHILWKSPEARDPVTVPGFTT